MFTRSDNILDAEHVKSVIYSAGQAAVGRRQSSVDRLRFICLSAVRWQLARRSSPAERSIMAHLVCDPFRVFAEPLEVPGVRCRSPLAEVCCPIWDTSHFSSFPVFPALPQEDPLQAGDFEANIRFLCETNSCSSFARQYGTSRTFRSPE
jgi:hypothetical protein